MDGKNEDTNFEEGEIAEANPIRSNFSSFSDFQPKSSPGDAYREKDANPRPFGQGKPSRFSDRPPSQISSGQIPPPRQFQSNNPNSKRSNSRESQNSYDSYGRGDYYDRGNVDGPRVDNRSTDRGGNDYRDSRGSFGGSDRGGGGGGGGRDRWANDDGYHRGNQDGWNTGPQGGSGINNNSTSGGGGGDDFYSGGYRGGNDNRRYPNPPGGMARGVTTGSFDSGNGGNNNNRGSGWSHGSGGFNSYNNEFDNAGGSSNVPMNAGPSSGNYYNGPSRAAAGGVGGFEGGSDYYDNKKERVNPFSQVTAPVNPFSGGNSAASSNNSNNRGAGGPYFRSPSFSDGTGVYGNNAPMGKNFSSGPPGPTPAAPSGGSPSPSKIRRSISDGGMTQSNFSNAPSSGVPPPPAPPVTAYRNPPPAPPQQQQHLPSGGFAPGFSRPPSGRPLSNPTTPNAGPSAVPLGVSPSAPAATVGPPAIKKEPTPQEVANLTNRSYKRAPAHAPEAPTSSEEVSKSSASKPKPPVTSSSTHHSTKHAPVAPAVEATPANTSTMFDTLSSVRPAPARASSPSVKASVAGAVTAAGVSPAHANNALYDPVSYVSNPHSGSHSHSVLAVAAAATTALNSEGATAATASAPLVAAAGGTEGSTAKRAKAAWGSGLIRQTSATVPDPVPVPEATEVKVEKEAESTSAPIKMETEEAATNKPVVGAEKSDLNLPSLKVMKPVSSTADIQESLQSSSLTDRTAAGSSKKSGRQSSSANTPRSPVKGGVGRGNGRKKNVVVESDEEAEFEETPSSSKPAAKVEEPAEFSGGESPRKRSKKSVVTTPTVSERKKISEETAAVGAGDEKDESAGGAPPSKRMKLEQPSVKEEGGEDEPAEEDASVDLPAKSSSGRAADKDKKSNAQRRGGGGRGGVKRVPSNTLLSAIGVHAGADAQETAAADSEARTDPIAEENEADEEEDDKNEPESGAPAASSSASTPAATPRKTRPAQVTTEDSEAAALEKAGITKKRGRPFQLSGKRKLPDEEQQEGEGGAEEDDESGTEAAGEATPSSATSALMSPAGAAGAASTAGTAEKPRGGGGRGRGGGGRGAGGGRGGRQAGSGAAGGGAASGAGALNGSAGGNNGNMALITSHPSKLSNKEKKALRERFQLGNIFSRESDIQRACHAIFCMNQLLKGQPAEASGGAPGGKLSSQYPFMSQDFSSIHSAHKVFIPSSAEISMFIDYLDSSSDMLYNYLKGIREKQYMSEAVRKDQQQSKEESAKHSTSAILSPASKAVAAKTAASSASGASKDTVSDAAGTTANEAGTPFMKAMKHKFNAPNLAEIKHNNQLRIVEAHLFATIINNSPDVTKSAAASTATSTLTNASAALRKERSNSIGSKTSRKMSLHESSTSPSPAGAPVAAAEKPATITDMVNDFMKGTAAPAYKDPKELPQYAATQATMSKNRGAVAAAIRDKRQARQQAWQSLGVKYVEVHRRWSDHVEAIEREEEGGAKEGPKLRGTQANMRPITDISRIGESTNVGFGGLSASNIPTAASMGLSASFNGNSLQLSTTDGNMPSNSFFNALMSQSGVNSRAAGLGVARSDYDQEKLLQQLFATEIRAHRIENGACPVPPMVSPWTQADHTAAPNMPQWSNSINESFAASTAAARLKNDTGFKKTPRKVDRDDSDRAVEGDRSAVKKEKTEPALTPVPFPPLKHCYAEYIDTNGGRLTLDGKRQICTNFALGVPCPVNCNCALQVDRLGKFDRIWTDMEKCIFVDKFLQFPKNFHKIASFLVNRSTKDCIKFYYDAKSTVEFKYLLKEFDNRRRTNKSIWSTTVKAAHSMGAAIFPSSDSDNKSSLVELPMDDAICSSFGNQPLNTGKIFNIPMSKVYTNLPPSTASTAAVKPILARNTSTGTLDMDPANLAAAGGGAPGAVPAGSANITQPYPRPVTMKLAKYRHMLSHNGLSFESLSLNSGATQPVAPAVQLGGAGSSSASLVQLAENLNTSATTSSSAAGAAMAMGGENGSDNEEEGGGGATAAAEASGKTPQSSRKKGGARKRVSASSAQQLSASYSAQLKQREYLVNMKASMAEGTFLSRYPLGPDYIYSYQNERVYDTLLPSHFYSSPDNEISRACYNQTAEDEMAAGEGGGVAGTSGSSGNNHSNLIQQDSYLGSSANAMLSSTPSVSNYRNRGVLTAAGALGGRGAGGLAGAAGGRGVTAGRGGGGGRWSSNNAAYTQKLDMVTAAAAAAGGGMGPGGLPPSGRGGRGGGGAAGGGRRTGGVGGRAGAADRAAKGAAIAAAAAAVAAAARQPRPPDTTATSEAVQLSLSKAKMMRKQQSGGESTTATVSAGSPASTSTSTGGSNKASPSVTDRKSAIASAALVTPAKAVATTEVAGIAEVADDTNNASAAVEDSGDMEVTEDAAETDKGVSSEKPADKEEGHEQLAEEEEEEEGDAEDAGESEPENTEEEGAAAENETDDFLQEQEEQDGEDNEEEEEAGGEDAALHSADAEDLEQPNDDEEEEEEEEEDGENQAKNADDPEHHHHHHHQQQLEEGEEDEPEAAVDDEAVDDEREEAAEDHEEENDEHIDNDEETDDVNEDQHEGADNTGLNNEDKEEREFINDGDYAEQQQTTSEDLVMPSAVSAVDGEPEIIGSNSGHSEVADASTHPTTAEEAEDAAVMMEEQEEFPVEEMQVDEDNAAVNDIVDVGQPMDDGNDSEGF